MRRGERMDKGTDSLREQIEELRDQLHSKIKKSSVNHKELMDEELLRISKKLDELIVQYMKRKRA